MGGVVFWRYMGRCRSTALHKKKPEVGYLANTYIRFVRCLDVVLLGIGYLWPKRCRRNGHLCFPARSRHISGIRWQDIGIWYCGWEFLSQLRDSPISSPTSPSSPPPPRPSSTSRPCTSPFRAPLPTPLPSKPFPAPAPLPLLNQHHPRLLLLPLLGGPLLGLLLRAPPRALRLGRVQRNVIGLAAGAFGVDEGGEEGCLGGAVVGGVGGEGDQGKGWGVLGRR